MILICDDDAAIRSSLTLVLKRAGYDTASVSTPQEAIDFVKSTPPDLILMDMNYTKGTSGEEGLTLLRQVKIYCPGVPVILITAWGSINLAVRGIQAGAFDFVTKPWNNMSLLSTIQTAIELRDGSEKDSVENSIARNNGDTFHYDKIIGKSPLLQNVFNTISRVAKTNASILITGESGTGKELIAEAIHENSNRKKAPFVKVNLGGISQSLFESEMFGHKKGAFTDAHYDRVGRFELANKGSIFLDEIGELDAACQVKLLRVLQDKTFESLGDSKQKQVDIRVISATNRNLADMVSKGTFREDLFYRINLITIRVPALRERIDDIPLLANYFAKKQVEINGLDKIEFTSEAIDFLKKLPYPGNIRELKNLVDRVILVSGKHLITDSDFKDQYIEIPNTFASLPDSIYPLDELEKNMIVKAMELYGGNLSKVATALGVSRQALYRRLEKYGMNTYD
ncbi:sigma-54-dependent Fis family transcriptional regulator [Dysgonomonas sp. 521]|uniref:sigma-54-dependent transcriptional regulator n=1 Tax=Dysgonomonas sp. 521 TaxID=2302932 RepID=UPI0013D7ED09|nr:sigma-54 dependent transcriptional regulator [Dysgonomonas sp. 521]NDV94939.1 sigma-54-dependent Fis family transcriptional regulator [Dysgonomonas sp. 521]